MEIKQEVKAYRVEYTCDSCSEGIMKPAGHIYMTAPPRYPHVCNICGVKQILDRAYPDMRFE